MTDDLSFLDPSTWPLLPPTQFRIYGDDMAESWGTVDEEDYHFLIQWRWSWTTPGRRANGQPRSKVYLRRNFEVQIESPYKSGGTYVNPETGYEVRARKPRVQQSIRMHTVIMLRTGIIPPTPHHHIVDHRDGDETNYRRSNLRWATHSMNRININGSHASDLLETT